MKRLGPLKQSTSWRHVGALAGAALLLLAAPARAGWPSIPGVPGVPSAKQAVKGVASNELLKEFGTWFNYNRPVYVSGNDVLPTVGKLPGGPWHPESLTRVLSLIKPSRSPEVHLPAGDYNVAVVTYCMGHNNQGPWRNKFLLAPIKGAWSDILVALNYRAFGSRFNPPQIQGLSWAMQAGMSYDEMGSTSKEIVDELLPEYKPRLNKDFYDSARDEWNSIAAKVPGAPSFEGALGQLGDTGKALLEIQDARNQIIADGNNFNAMIAQFSHLGQTRPRDVISSTPWSIIAPGVYARLRTKGTLLTPGVMQIRITAQAASRGFQVASTHLRGLGGNLASLSDIFNFLFGGDGGFLDGPTQPLSTSPTGGEPDPTQSGGGSDGSSSNSNGSFGDNGGNGSNPSGSNNGSKNNNSNNNDNNDDNNDNNNNGGNNGTNGGHGNPVNPVKTGNPLVKLGTCDPPGNVFGVVSGTVVSTSSTSLVLGRGAGNGTVCLLLRPYVDTGALGFASGTLSVNSGNASYSLPTSMPPGHVVMYVRYLAAFMPLIPRGPAPPSAITAVIDFAGVGSFCSDLTNTIALSHGHAPLGDPPINWLSSASLENRLCITNMSGAQIVVHAWVAPAKIIGPTTTFTPVDPQNFLYNDAWGHM